MHSTEIPVYGKQEPSAYNGYFGSMHSPRAAVRWLEGNILPQKEHREVPFDLKLLDGYMEQYQLAPDFILSITREGDKLFAQAGGQPKAPDFFRMANGSSSY